MESDGHRAGGHAFRGPSPLVRYDYPPDAEVKAVEFVLEQEAPCVLEDWKTTCA